MVESSWIKRWLLYPSMNLRMRLVLPEFGLPITIRSIFTFPTCSDYYAIIYNPPRKDSKQYITIKYLTQSISPGLFTSVAPHETSHWLIRSTNLLLIFTVSCFFMTIPALLTCIFVSLFLHVFIKTSSASLEHLHLNFSYVFSCSLVEVQLLIIV